MKNKLVALATDVVIKAFDRFRAPGEFFKLIKANGDGVVYQLEDYPGQDSKNMSCFARRVDTGERFFVKWTYNDVEVGRVKILNQAGAHKNIVEHQVMRDSITDKEILVASLFLPPQFFHGQDIAESLARQKLKHFWERPKGEKEELIMLQELQSADFWKTNSDSIYLAAKIMVDVLNALIYLEQHSLTYQDTLAANVILTVEDDVIVAKLTDFEIRGNQPHINRLKEMYSSLFFSYLDCSGCVFQLTKKIFAEEVPSLEELKSAFEAFIFTKYSTVERAAWAKRNPNID